MEYIPTNRDRTIDNILGVFEADNFTFTAPKYEIKLNEAFEKYHVPIVKWFEKKYDVQLDLGLSSIKIK